ncbi:DUF4111 domain-containing protein (plasmid) [Salmonella enterica subsp. enterica]|nr:DUF4111 domain-containing protein [Salmonella enterica subsp. enterica]
MLTLSRIWYSAPAKSRRRMSLPTGHKRLPAQYQPVLLEAKQAYLGQKKITWPHAQIT